MYLPPQSMPMRPASAEFGNRKSLNYTSIPLPIVNATERTDEDLRRNVLLRTVNCKAANMSLVKEVKDINPPLISYYRTIIS